MEHQSPVYVNASFVVFLISVCTFCVVAGTASLSMAGTDMKKQNILLNSDFVRVISVFID